VGAPTEGAPADEKAPADDAIAQLKLGWKGLRSQIAAATASATGNDAAGAEASTSASSSSASNAGEAGGGGSWASWAKQARKIVVENAKVAYDAVPTADSGSRNNSDVEQGEGPGAMAQLNQFGSWAKSMGSKVTEKAKSLELGEHADTLQKSVSTKFGKLGESAQEAQAAMKEKGKAAAAKTKEFGGKAGEKFEAAKEKGKEKAKAAKEKAGQAAAGAKGALAGVGERVGGMGALMMSPAKLAQFAGVAFVGIFLISTSFTFLPVFVIAPQKFALLFAFGSMTLLGSLTILKGPQAFLTSITGKDQLPFTAAYVVGLVGTLAATIVMRSFILTAVFGTIQALALAYFLASYVPGGKALLNLCGRCCGKAARKVGLKCVPGQT